MQWLDVKKIAIALEEEYPDADNVNLRYTDFRASIMALPGFVGAENGCNEKILEAIQLAWLDERD